ncbi:MAG: ABA4-like family protein [Candidatus Fonsibacter sp.]
MLNTLKDFFTLEMIYHFTNIGVIPMWILLAFLPGWNGTKVLINSILVPLILSLTYFYVLYIYINTSEGIFSNILNKGKIFELYMGIDQLKKIFSDKNVLLLFWIHFLTANLILGAWIATDAAKNKALQFIVLVPLVLTYFAGPLGLGVYLILRLLAAQKFKLFD